jgi:hypothetical protein
MEVAAAFTVWITFGGWLFLGVVEAPRSFGRIALTLCAAELAAAAIWSYGSETCLQRPCAAVPELAREAAALDIPILTVVALVLGIVYAFRSASTPPDADADSRHGRAREGRRRHRQRAH